VVERSRALVLQLATEPIQVRVAQAGTLQGISQTVEELRNLGCMARRSIDSAGTDNNTGAEVRIAEVLGLQRVMVGLLHLQREVGVVERIGSS